MGQISACDNKVKQNWLPSGGGGVFWGWQKLRHVGQSKCKVRSRGANEDKEPPMIACGVLL